MSKKKMMTSGKWKREFDFDFDTKVFFTITTDLYIIQLTGGSVIIRNKTHDHEIKCLKGYHYLYTGDVKPDESELFVLENGKHFYVISLKNYVQIKKVTLPRTYEAIDVYGDFSDDGKTLLIPVYKYVDNEYKYWLCEYETDKYSLVNMKSVKQYEVNHWLNI